MSSFSAVARKAGDAPRAHTLIQKVLAARPEHLPSLYLSGLIDFQLGSFASAEEALRKVTAQTGEPGARRMLAQIYLRGGRPASAACPTMTSERSEVVMFHPSRNLMLLGVLGAAIGVPYMLATGRGPQANPARWLGGARRSSCTSTRSQKTTPSRCR